MFDHAPGFFRRQVQPVFPQVAVFQAAVLGEFFLIRHQGKQARIAAHQAFPGIKDAVVVAFDVGTEVDRIAEQGGVVALHVSLVDAQQGVTEHRRRAVEVGCGEDHHRAMRRDVLVPLGEFLTVRCGQVIELQLFAQPARSRREYTLGMFIAETGRRIKRANSGP
ncbi:hypothetical protein D3C72_1614970 [compost metagenome]